MNKMAAFLSETAADVDSLLRRPVESKVLSRWERKELQQQQQVQKHRTPGQRRRSSMDLSLNTSSTAKTPGRNATTTTSLLNTSSSSSKTPARRNSLSLLPTRTPGKASSAPSAPGSANPKTPHGDRFVPSRAAMEQQQHKPIRRSLGIENECQGNSLLMGGEEKSHTQRLAESLFEVDDLNSKVLAFKHKAPKPTAGFDNNLRVLYTQNTSSFGRGARSSSSVSRRLLKQTPERVLDAPELADDYYLNLLHWSAQNQLAVALSNAVYIWNADTGSISMLWESPSEEEMITSLRWTGDGSHLAVGTSSHVVKVWDAKAQKCLRTMKGHQSRVGSLSWNNHILTSGGRDAMIFHHDVRQKKHKIALLQGHQEEVCGLAWNLEGTQLASGSNDNLCMIWDMAGRQSLGSVHTPRLTFSESQAAVKALAWSPHERNLLATGSGTADRHIRFYNTSGNGQLVNSIDTQSQVCSLVWAPRKREILSSHGFAQNQLAVWNYPSLALVGELKAHTSRVLHTALSPDGTTVCSAAADETLRFWNVWEPAEKKRLSASSGFGSSGSKQKRLNIR